MIAPLPPGAWTQAEGGCTARIPMPDGARCVVWTQGWDATTAALAVAGTTRFTLLAHSAYAMSPVTGGAILLRAPRPPEGGVAISIGRGSPTLGAGWPRAMRARTVAPPQAVAPDAATVAQRLEAGEVETLLAMLGEALLGGAAHEPILAAARGLFLHRARHPLAPDPGLAPLLAALSALDTP